MPLRLFESFIREPTASTHTVCMALMCAALQLIPTAAVAAKKAAVETNIVGVASVIDGDTLEIHGQRIRLWGIDAPESRQVCMQGSNSWRCGTAAANTLDGFIAGRTLHCRQLDTDRYKRAVARCKIGDEDLNAWLVNNGWALDYVRYSDGAFADEQIAAEAHKRGIWASEFQKPWEWRRK